MAKAVIITKDDDGDIRARVITTEVPEQQNAPVAATATGTSTGTTSIALTNVTGKIQVGSTMTGTGVPAGITIVSAPIGGGAGNYTTSAPTTLAAVALTFTVGATVPVFPDFVPIIPTSTPPGGVGQIGEAVATPTFPPPTPPPIGHVPVGPLVGPAVAAAGVPPSLPGVVQPQFQAPGNATTPPANGYFPKFTTTTAYAGFPNNPPAGVPIVFSNIYTGGATQITPPSTPTVAQITLNGMSILVPHMLAGEDDADAVRDGHTEFSERSAGSVLSGEDPSQLHQPRTPKNSRRQRLLAGDPGGRANGT